MGETRRLEGLGQLGFDFPTKSSGVPARSQGNEAEVFLDADPCELFVGAQRLDAYLREVGLGWVLRLAALLRELDLSALIDRYQLTGRKAFHPRTLLGLNRLWDCQPGVVIAGTGRIGAARRWRVVVVWRS